jgi:hypothetical protein
MMIRASEPPMKVLRLSYDFVEIRDFMLSAPQKRGVKIDAKYDI